MGGVFAGVVLIAIGVASIVVGISGRSTVRDNLANEAIVGSPDMTPALIKAEAAKAGVTGIDLPTCCPIGGYCNSGSDRVLSGC